MFSELPEEQKVKIRLLRNLPVAPKHGATEGREFEAARVLPEDRSHGSVYWRIIGDAGDVVGVLFREAEEIQ